MMMMMLIRNTYAAPAPPPRGDRVAQSEIRRDARIFKDDSIFFFRMMLRPHLSELRVMPGDLYTRHFEEIDILYGNWFTMYAHAAERRQRHGHAAFP